MTEKKIIERNLDGIYDNYRIPGIVTTEKGSILVYYECRKSDSDWAEIDIGMRKSRDGGVTWSDRTILVYGNGKTVNNPIMFSDQEKLLFMWQEEYSRTFSMCSYDDGETWEEKKELTAYTKTEQYDYTVIACGPGHGTVLRSGRYITPVWMCSNHANPKAHQPSVVATFYSDDRGEGWKLGEILKDEKLTDANETALAETEEGEIILNIRHRNEKHVRLIARSKSGIGDWEEIDFDEALPDPRCAAGMVSDGETIYFSNCRDPKERHSLTLTKSTDGCASWYPGMLIDQEAGYSDLALSRDKKRLYIFYENFSEERKDLVFTGLATEELTLQADRREYGRK